LSRLPQLIYDDMSPAQQQLHDEILAGPRTRIAGPMHAWFLNPDYGTLIQKVGAFCRYETSLPPRLSELAIIIVARYWSADVEWFAHSAIALENDIAQTTVEAIEQDQRPDFENGDEAVIYDLTKSILETKRVSEELYQKAISDLGEKTLLDLTAIIGYYCNIAVQLNVFDIPDQEGRIMRPVD
jgi:4-carboxymuconolactone decarboxylase